MIIIPSASVTPGRHASHVETQFVAQSSESSCLSLENAAVAKDGVIHQPVNWLVTEDAYFPFDADSFEER